jgi:alpha-glucosidase (family GH31 glycosyl hydrolase)
VFKSLILLVCTLGSSFAFADQIQELQKIYLNGVSLAAPIYPSWVHRHWVWENEGNQDSARQLVDDYLAHQIPVGVLIIDRPWDTAPNSFIPSPLLYPDLGKEIQQYHARNVKVVMWATSIINREAETFPEANEKGFLLENRSDLDWWGGLGGLLDYHQPAAVIWWHKQMDRILDLGIDGWKVDATDPLVLKMYNTFDALSKWAQYKRAEYGDFFNYTRSKLGNDRIIMARPVDDYIGLGLPVTFAKPEINFAGWVGDQDGNYKGLSHALTNILASADLDYPVIGSDIGGFRTVDGQVVRDKKLFIRWAQLGALMPLMENGGDGEHRPWKYDQEVEDIYRKYAVFHEELVPYFYSQTAVAIQKKKSPIVRVGSANDYLIGDSIFVSPIWTSNDNVTVCLPKGRWRLLWTERDSLRDCQKRRTFALIEYPAYVKAGSLIPIQVTSDLSSFGSKLSKDHLTVLFYPDFEVVDSEQIVPVYSDKESAGLLSYRQTAGAIEFQSSKISKPLIYRIAGIGNAKIISKAKPVKQVRNFKELVSESLATWRDQDTLWIKTSGTDSFTLQR